MAVNTTGAEIQHVGTGSNTTFSFPYKFEKSSDLVVELTNAAGVIQADLVEGTDYTVTGAGDDSGGSISTLNKYGALTLNWLLTIRRVTDKIQDNTYDNLDGFPPDEHEAKIDRAFQLIQELQAEMLRCVKFDSSDKSANRAQTTLKTYSDRINKILAFNSTATDFDYLAVGDIITKTGVIAEYASVAALTSDTNISSYTTGQTLQLNGYYAFGDFGNPIHLRLEASIGGIKSHTLNDGRYANLYVHGYVNLAWMGLRGEDSDAETYKVTNGQVFDDALTYLNTNFSRGHIYIPPLIGKIYTDRKIELYSNSILENDGNVVAEKDGGFRLVNISNKSNIIVTGNGIFDWNAHVDDFRVTTNGGNAIHLDNATNVKISNLTFTNTGTICVHISDCQKIWVHHCNVLNATGNVDTETNETVSGDNQDGIHFYNCSYCYCHNNYVESIDDSIAWSYNTNSGFGTVDDKDSVARYFMGVFTNNITHPMKASRVHDGSQTSNGTIAKVLAHNYRFTVDGNLTDDSPAATAYIDGLICANNTLIGGKGGIVLGNTGSGNAIKFVRNALITNNVIRECLLYYESDVDKNTIYNAVDRATAGAIIGHSVEDVEISHNQIYRCGATGIRFRGNMENVRILNNTIRDIDLIETAVASTEGDMRAGIFIHATINDVNDIVIKDNRVEDTDGGGIVVRKEPADNFTNLTIEGNLVKNSNRNSNTSDMDSAYAVKALLVNEVNFGKNFVEGHTTNSSAWEFGHLAMKAGGALVNIQDFSQLTVPASRTSVSLVDGDINTGTDIITKASHGFSNGNLVVHTSDTTVIGGLAEDTPFWVVGVSGNDFQVAATPGGSAIDLTSVGSGTRSISTHEFFIETGSGVVSQVPEWRGATNCLMFSGSTGDLLHSLSLLSNTLGKGYLIDLGVFICNGALRVATNNTADYMEFNTTGRWVNISGLYRFRLGGDSIKLICEGTTKFLLSHFKLIPLEY